MKSILEQWLTDCLSTGAKNPPLYEIAAEEVESGHCDGETWARALAEANADRGRARAVYMKLRVARLPQEIAAFHAAQEEARRPFYESVRALARAGIPDMHHVPAEKYMGEPASLSQPIPAAELSRATGLLEFQITDLIKMGKLSGVLCGGDWFVDGVYAGKP